MTNEEVKADVIATLWDVPDQITRTLSVRGRQYSPAELIREVELGTEIGLALMEAHRVLVALRQEYSL